MSFAGLDPGRATAAVVALALYAALCLAVVVRERRRVRATAREASALAHAGVPAILVVHASQTGSAERLAWETARALQGAGVALRVAALGTLAPGDLVRHRTALFVASTTGEGDAPDAAAGFVRRFMDAVDVPAGLAGLKVGMLALGDREFGQYCGFGRRLDAWLQAQGAQPLFERIEVDRLTPAALHRWQHELGRLASIGDVRDWSGDAPRHWRLAARRQLNDDVDGRAVFHLELEPEGADAVPAWESGDLARVTVPGANARPREYSIASVPADGRVHLLVRRERRADGTPGLASGWLTSGAALGASVELALARHPNFQLGHNATRPLILVANGTGIAGLRSHLKARIAAGRSRHWLLFGERHAAHDFHFGDEIEAWRASGAIERVDLAFSRDQSHKVYVQDRLRAAAPAVRAWLADGAAIYVCGSLEGMATGVEAALVEVIGRVGLQALIDEGRYRRDVY